MLKTITLLFTLALVMNSAIAGSHSIQDYDVVSEGKTVSKETARFDSASAPIKEGWFKFKVELNVPRSYVDEKTGKTKQWNEKKNVWFRTRGKAEAFSAVMNSDRATDIYYNFNKNSKNTKATSSACQMAIAGLFCKDFPVTVINQTDIDAKDAFAYDPASGKNIPLMDYIGNHYDDGKVSLEDSSQDDSGRGYSPKHDLDPSDKKPSNSSSRAVSA